MRKIATKFWNIFLLILLIVSVMAFVVSMGWIVYEAEVRPEIEKHRLKERERNILEKNNIVSYVETFSQDIYSLSLSNQTEGSLSGNVSGRSETFGLFVLGCGWVSGDGNTSGSVSGSTATKEYYTFFVKDKDGYFIKNKIDSYIVKIKQCNEKPKLIQTIPTTTWINGYGQRCKHMGKSTWILIVPLNTIFQNVSLK